MADGQLVQFPFRSGIDENVDPKAAPPGTLTSLVNMRQVKLGRLERRQGHTALTKSIFGGGALGACTRLATRKKELLLCDGNSLYGYSSGQSKWVLRDTAARCMARHEVVQQFDQIWTDPVYVCANGVEVFAWIYAPASLGGAGTITSMVRDVATGTVLIPPTFNSHSLGGSNALSPNLIVTGTTIVLVWADNIGGNINATSLDTTNVAAGWSTPATLVTDIDKTNTRLSAVATASGHFVVAYVQATTSFLGLAECSISGGTFTVNATGDVASGANGSISLAYDGSSVVYAVFLAAGPVAVAASINSTTLAGVAGPTTIYSGGSDTYHTGIVITGSGAGTTLHILIINDQVAFPSVYMTSTTAFSTTTQGNFYWLNGWAGPWVVGTRVFVVIRYAKTDFVCELLSAGASTNNPLRVHAVLAPRQTQSGDGTASGEHANYQTLGQVCANGTHWRFAGTQVADANLNSRNGLVVHDLVMGDDWIENGANYPAQHMEPVEFGELTHFSGGVVSSYDSQQLVEAAFLYGPQHNPVSLIPATSGGSLGPGVYQYVFTYEWTDSAGQVYRSEPSVPIAVTTTGVGTVNEVAISVPMLALTNKQKPVPTLPLAPTTQVHVIVYRTTVNGDGSLFYRQTPYAVPSTNLNDPAGGWATLTDKTSDADLTAAATAQLLYTNGGTLANQTPPCLSTLIKHQQRLCGIGDDGKTIWFSSEYVDREAPKWNDALTIELPEPLTALATMDDRILAFSQDHIWFITGSGPNDLGTGSDWSQPIRVPADSGCIDPRSIINTPEGVMFRSYAGFYFIDRQLSVTYIGSLITDTAAANPLDVCALFQARDETSCFISMMPSAGSSTGVRMHWDTFHQTWSTDQLTDGATTSAQVAAMASWDGSIVWATTGGQVYQQSTAQWTDGSSWFDSSFVTAFVAEGGPMSWQRVRFVQVNGDYVTPHDLKMSFAFDHDDAFVQSHQFTAGNLKQYGLEYAKLRVGSQNGANPRCEGIKVKVEILTPTNPTDYPIGTGQSATFSGMGLEIVPKRGQRRLGAGVSA